jgi:ABC-2 type transport system permease protein
MLGACVVVASGCSSSGLTASKLEKAFAPTFANLVQVQEAKLGLPYVSASAFRASATCHRVGPGNETSGSGNWMCTVSWSVPGHSNTLRDGYDLSVTPDGCYTASADGEEAHVGGPTLTTRQGATVTNLVYVFDGCFDPT